MYTSHWWMQLRLQGLWNSLFIRHLKICVNYINAYLLNGKRESVVCLSITIKITAVVTILFVYLLYSSVKSDYVTVLGSIKIKVSPRTHWPNRETYRSMLIFETCQIYIGRSINQFLDPTDFYSIFVLYAMTSMVARNWQNFNFWVNNP